MAIVKIQAGRQIQGLRIHVVFSRVKIEAAHATRQQIHLTIQFMALWQISDQHLQY